MSLPASEFFEIERHGAVAELAMNRPDKANGMTPHFWADLPVLVAALDADPTVRAIVLTGRGRNFTRRRRLFDAHSVHDFLLERRCFPERKKAHQAVSLGTILRVDGGHHAVQENQDRKQKQHRLNTKRHKDMQRDMYIQSISTTQRRSVTGRHQATK